VGRLGAQSPFGEFSCKGKAGAWMVAEGFLVPWAAVLGWRRSRVFIGRENAEGGDR
jgi:hypothetical protein